jgi:hypothetical protein
MTPERVLPGDVVCLCPARRQDVPIRWSQFWNGGDGGTRSHHAPGSAANAADSHCGEGPKAIRAEAGRATPGSHLNAASAANSTTSCGGEPARQDRGGRGLRVLYQLDRCQHMLWPTVWQVTAPTYTQASRPRPGATRSWSASRMKAARRSQAAAPCQQSTPWRHRRPARSLPRVGSRGAPSMRR